MCVETDSKIEKIEKKNRRYQNDTGVSICTKIAARLCAADKVFKAGMKAERERKIEQEKLDAKAAADKRKAKMQAVIKNVGMSRFNAQRERDMR